MKARDWLEAHRAKMIVHDWATLTLKHKGRACRLPVSADALRIWEGHERVRRSAGAHACDQLAQVIVGPDGTVPCHMLTPKLIDLRHVAASVILDGSPGSPLGTTLLNAVEYLKQVILT